MEIDNELYVLYTMKYNMTYIIALYSNRLTAIQAFDSRVRYYHEHKEEGLVLTLAKYIDNTLDSAQLVHRRAF